MSEYVDRMRAKAWDAVVEALSKAWPGWQVTLGKPTGLECAVEAIRLMSEKARPIARPVDEWHEDLGNVIWWRFPIVEPPWVGTPHDEDWPQQPYYTHFTPLVLPENHAKT